MLTECPHCLSVLKVSAEQIYAGDPRVRCGECLRVFSARDHLTQADADLDTTKIYQPPRRETATTEESYFSLKPEVAEGLQAIVDKPQKKKQTRAVTNAVASTTTVELPPVERARRAAIPSRTTDIPTHTADKASPNTPSEPIVKKPAPAPAAMADSSNEGSKDRHISVLSRNNNSGRSAPIRSWSVLTFLLLGVLTLLAINAVRSVANNESMRASLSNAWCSIGPCGASASREFSQLKILRRKIYAHPNAEGVLVISLAMVNQLAQEMEYPTLQVRMTDQNGEVIARGHFEPSHYVPGYEAGMTIAPERVLDVVLQVEDPGEAAQSFDLEFK